MLIRKCSQTLFILILAIFTSSLTSCSNKGFKADVESDSIIFKEEVSNVPSGQLEGNNTITSNDKGIAEITFIDTGNSDSILITQDGISILIDGGNNDDGDLIVKTLKDKSITSLDIMIATHPHEDHIGGLDDIINKLEVKKLLVSNGDSDTKTYRDFIQAAANKKVNPSVPLEESKFSLTSNSYIQFFNTKGNKDTNNSSLVTLFVNGDDKFLFTGDAEEEIELELVNKIPDIDVLKVGHHGSSTSTTDKFLKNINPEYAVMTVGSNNKYGHPHIETVTKLEEANIEVHRTDECSSITFTSTGSGVSTECAVGSYKRGIKK